jgi:hypothetical protein
VPLCRQNGAAASSCILHILPRPTWSCRKRIFGATPALESTPAWLYPDLESELKLLFPIRNSFNANLTLPVHIFVNGDAPPEFTPDHVKIGAGADWDKRWANSAS